MYNYFAVNPLASIELKNQVYYLNLVVPSSRVKIQYSMLPITIHLKYDISRARKF